MLDWSPANGSAGRGACDPQLYEARGEFQLTVEFMRRAGLGVLFERFARLKARLEAEGLVRGAAQDGPCRASRHASVSSPLLQARRCATCSPRCGAACPRIPIVLYPTPVQGEGAAAQIAATLGTAGRRRRVRRADPVSWRRQHRGPVGLQRGNRGAGHRRLPRPGDLRRRSRDRLHHRRFRGRRTSADTDRGGGVGEPGPVRARGPGAGREQPPAAQRAAHPGAAHAADRLAGAQAGPSGRAHRTPAGRARASAQPPGLSPRAHAGARTLDACPSGTAPGHRASRRKLAAGSSRCAYASG